MRSGAWCAAGWRRRRHGRDLPADGARRPPARDVAGRGGQPDRRARRTYRHGLFHGHRRDPAIHDHGEPRNRLRRLGHEIGHPQRHLRAPHPPRPERAAANRAIRHQYGRGSRLAVVPCLDRGDGEGGGRRVHPRTGPRGRAGVRRHDAQRDRPLQLARHRQGGARGRRAVAGAERHSGDGAQDDCAARPRPRPA